MPFHSYLPNNMLSESGGCVNDNVCNDDSGVRLDFVGEILLAERATFLFNAYSCLFRPRQASRARTHDLQKAPTALRVGGAPRL